MSKYKIGDELKIRQWDDMLAEYGLNGLGSINCKFHFAEEMKHLCGKNFTVCHIRSDGRYIPEENSGYWSFSDEMLEPKIEKELYIATESELNDLLYGGAST